MYDLTSTTLTPNNGIGINIINTANTEPNIFLESVVNGAISTSQDAGFKFSASGLSRNVLVLARSSTEITLSMHISAQAGYAPVAQKVWTSIPAQNQGLYYSPSIYLGNSSTNFMEMFVNSIKYQELNADLLKAYEVTSPNPSLNPASGSRAHSDVCVGRYGGCGLIYAIY